MDILDLTQHQIDYTIDIPAKTKVAAILLTPKCNMTCSFCVTEDDFQALPFADAVALLDALNVAGVNKLVFGGGEPFYWPHDVSQLARAAKQRGFFVQVGTNGILLPDDFAELDAIDRFILPIESLSTGPHNRMRLYKHRHQQLILERLLALSRKGRSVTLSTVITQDNHQEVETLAAYLKQHQAEYGNIHAWHLYQFLPFGRGGARNQQRLQVPESVYFEVVEQVRQHQLPFTVFQRAQMYQSKEVSFFCYRDGKVVSDC